MDKKKILLVDDDPDILMVISAILTSNNFEVVTASSRDEGLKKVQEERPAMIILDVNMETPDAGFDMNRRLRTMAEFKTLPILMLTGIDTISAGNQVVDLYRQMRGTEGFEDDTVLKVKSADGSIAVDYKAEDGNTYWLPLDGFLGKPVEEDRLLKEIHRLLK